MRKAAAQGSTAPARLRIAIYTRKSTEEGLEQDFNSLHAQREACEAYVGSQKHEGWSLVPDIYDDGGYSGGTMDRPALKALLAEIAASRVDVIVVYKVDRLTRSLADFAKIVDVLDGAGASFVSVTQSFNTTTSMGRLTLNVLLSFAQFEREVTGERIRDKIAQSKARGMWMGGPVPLGYDLHDRRLIVNADETETVRFMFRRYLELGSGVALVDELDRLGIRSKQRIGRDGRSFGGQRIHRGPLYALLQNRIYLGEVTHKGNIYPGQHEGIVDRAMFDAVQAQLAQGRVERRHRTNARNPSPLAGLLFDQHGRRMGATHAVKGTKRYRYYISEQRNAEDERPIVRVSAADLEAAVTSELARAAEEAAHQLVGSGQVDSHAIRSLGRQRTAIVAELGSGAKAVRTAVLLRLLRRVELHPHALKITLDLSSLHPLLTEPLAIESPITIANTNVGRRMIIAGPDAAGRRDPALIRFVAQAHQARRMLETSGEPFPAVAERLGYGRDYMMDLLRVSYLAPDITRAIIEGRQSPSLTRARLSRINLPLDWSEQRQALGIG